MGLNAKAVNYIRGNNPKLRNARKSLMNMDLDRIVNDLSARALDPYGQMQNMNQNYAQLNMIQEHARGGNDTDSDEDSEDEDDMRSNFQKLQQ